MKCVYSYGDLSRQGTTYTYIARTCHVTDSPSRDIDKELGSNRARVHQSCRMGLRVPAARSE